MSDMWNFDFQGVTIRAFLRSGDVFLPVADLGRAVNLTNPHRTARDHCRAPQRLTVAGPDNNASMVCVTGRDIDRFCQACNPPADALQAFVVGRILPELRNAAAPQADAPGAEPGAPALVAFESGEPRTTSLALANGTGRDHATVLRLTRESLEDLEEFGRVGFEIRPFQTAGGVQKQECALLNEQQATLLLTYMRNNDRVRAFKKALVRAFYEMRNRLENPSVNDSIMAALNDPIQMRTVLLASVERELALREEVKTLSPKAVVHDRIVESGGAMTLREAATTLGITPQRKLREWMRANGWIYGSGSAERAYQVQLQTGRLMHRVYLQQTEDGDEVSRVTVKITPKGLARLADIFAATPPA